MPTLLFIIGLVALFFIISAGILLRPKGRHWTRVALAIPCIILCVLALVTIAGLAWGHYTPPPAAEVIAKIQHCADQKARPAVVAALEKSGFQPIICEPLVSAEAVANAAPNTPLPASRVELHMVRVRPHDLFAEYLNVVFLFDAQGQLITWTYTIESPSL